LPGREGKGRTDSRTPEAPAARLRGRHGVPTQVELQAILRAVDEDHPRTAARLLAKTPRGWRDDPTSWQWLSDRVRPERLLPVALELRRQGHPTFAAGVLARTNLEDATPQQLRRVGRALIQGGQYDAARSLYAGLIATEERPGNAYPDELSRKDTHGLELAEFCLAANDHLGRLPTPARSRIRGFVLVYNLAHQVLAGLMVPMARPLMENGYVIKSVITGSPSTPRTGVGKFDRLQGCVVPNGERFVGQSRREPSHAWKIDWPSGVVEAEGINYYPYFQERLAQKARRYKTDSLDDPETAEMFDALLRQADVALTLCDKLLELALKHGKPVRIALVDSHFAPYGVFREWCRHVGRHHDIHAIGISIGYENYYSNLTSLQATTLAVEDLTAQPDVRQPFLGGSHRLEATLTEQPELDRDPDDQVMAWICQDRSKVDVASASRADILHQVEQARSRGGRVFVALGKVSIDFAAPGDHGFAHDDFVEWINHLVEAVAGTDNLLLIKPHPHELRKEIVVDGVQSLRDLVVPDLPANVCFLDHDSFNTHELAEFVDTAFLWNGTAALEFTVLGVPAVPASTWAVKDYPVGLPVLRSAQEYEEVLRGERVLEVDDDSRRRAATFLRLMRSDHVAIPYRYVKRAATNMDVRAPKLDVEMLSRLEESPDPFVLRAASRFFEFD
jgi:hypothetical protein